MFEFGTSLVQLSWIVFIGAIIIAIAYLVKRKKN